MLNHILLDDKNIIYSDYLKDYIYDLTDNKFEIPQSYNFQLFKVTKDYIARPDLIALDAYGDTMFADVICKLNGISNPFELNEGQTLIIPSIEDVIYFKIQSKYDKFETNASNNKSSSNKSPKLKNEKRQANESIIGDSRFKIDATNGIIIY